MSIRQTLRASRSARNAVAAALITVAGQAWPLVAGADIPLPGDDPEPPEESDRGGRTHTIQVRGYVEDTLTSEYIRDRDRLAPVNATRARLNLSGKPDAHVDFGIGVVGTLYTGHTTIRLADYLPSGERAQLEPPDETLRWPGAADLFVYELTDGLYLQEAFGTLYLPHLRLRAGRHKFYTGTGFAYNPIDLFNRKNPLDPTYEVDGLDALLITLELPAQFRVEGLAIAGDRLGRSDYLAKLSGHLGGWDVGVQYTHHIRARTDWSALNTPAAIAGLMFGQSTSDFDRKFRWHMAAAEMVGEIWEIGLHAEGGYAWIEPVGDSGGLTDAARDHERLLVGMDHTFDSELYVLVEYLRLGQGRTDASQITLDDRMALMAGEVLAINQSTLFTGLSYPLTDLTEIALYAIVGVDDTSALINPWLLVDVYAGAKLSLTAYAPVGQERSQNGRAGPSGFARLRISF